MTITIGYLPTAFLNGALETVNPSAYSGPAVQDLQTASRGVLLELDGSEEELKKLLDPAELLDAVDAHQMINVSEVRRTAIELRGLINGHPNARRAIDTVRASGLSLYASFPGRTLRELVLGKQKRIHDLIRTVDERQELVEAVTSGDETLARSTVDVLQEIIKRRLNRDLTLEDVQAWKLLESVEGRLDVLKKEDAENSIVIFWAGVILTDDFLDLILPEHPGSGDVLRKVRKNRIS